MSPGVGWFLLALVVSQISGGLIWKGMALSLPWLSTLCHSWALAGIVGLCAVHAQRGSRPRLPLLTPCLAFTGWAFVSLYWTSDRFRGELAVLDLFVPLMVYLAAAELCRHHTWRNRLALACIAIVALCSVYAMGVFGGVFSSGYVQAGSRSAAPFRNPNHAAYVYELCFLLAGVMVFVTKSPPARFFLGYATVLIGLGHLLTISRAGWLALGFSVFLFTRLLGPEALSRRVRTVLGVAVLTLVVWMGLRVASQPLLKRVESVSLTSGANSRVQLWAAAVRMAADRPFTGHGVAGYDHAFARYRKAGQAGRPEYAHNDYLEVACDFGLPGLTLLLWALVVFWREALEGLRHSHSDLKRQAKQAAAISGCAAVMVHELFDFGLCDPAIFALFAAVAALATRVRRLEVPTRHAWVPGLAALGLFVALAGRAPSVRQASILLCESEAAQQARRFDLASRLADDACQSTPADPECWLAAGQAWLARAEFAENLGLLGSTGGQEALANAIQRLTRARELNPWVRGAPALLARALLLKDPREALPVLAESCRNESHDPDLAVLHALCLLRVDRRDEAIAVLRTILSEAETHGSLRSFRARLVDLFPRVADLERVVPEALTETRRALAEALLKRGRPDDASLFLERLAAVSGDTRPDVLLRLASVRQGQGLTTAAADALSAAVEASASGKKSRALLPLASARRAMGQTTEALRVVDEALAEKETPEALGVKAELLALAGKKDESRAVLRRAVSQAQSDWRTAVKLAERLPPEEALAKLLEIGSGQPDRPEPHLARARVLERIGERYEAMLSLLKASKLAPDDLRLRDMLAERYEKLNLPQQAAAEWRQIVEKRPGEAWPLERLASFHERQNEWDDCLATLDKLRSIPGAKYHGKELGEALREITIRKTRRDASRAFPKEPLEDPGR